MAIYELPRFNPRSFQTEIIRDVVERQCRRILISACRRGGKDYIGLASADILAQLHPGSNIGYLGLSLKSLKKILMSNDQSGRPMFESVIDCKNVLKQTRNGEYFFRETGCFKYKNGSMLYLLGTDANMELGTSMRCLVITESARIPFDAWTYLVPSIEGSDGTIIQVSTPFFGSDFNDLMTNEHPLSPEYSMHIVPADTLLEADGTRVYSDEKLERIKRGMDLSTFRQEYMVDARSINKVSIMGFSLERATTRDFVVDDSTQIHHVFDLGQEDHCAMTTVITQDGKTPIIYDYMIKNKTALSVFTDKIKRQSEELKISRSKTVIVLPFDSDQDFQGYSGKINRYQEVKNNMIGYDVQLIGRTDKMRGLQVSRTVLETGKIAIHSVDGEITDKMRDWMKIIGSVNYKVEKSTNKIIYTVDKRSGIFGDHPIDSFRYVVVWLFRHMFDEDRFFIEASKDDVRYDYSELYTGHEEVNKW